MWVLHSLTVSKIQTMLFRTYFIVAFRQLLKKPVFYLLNIGGLGVGMAAFMSIMLYVGYHFRFDGFHDHVNNTYRIVHTFKKQVPPYSTVATYSKVGVALKEEYSMVEQQCRLVQTYGGGVQLTKDDEQILIENSYYADASFFDIFSFPLIAGNSADFDEYNTIAISRELSNSIYGQNSPVGEIIEMSSVNGTTGFEIVGVFENKQPSHINADVLISLVTLERAWNANFATGWGSFDFVTYVRLVTSADPVAFEAVLPAFADRHGGENRGSSRVELALQPLADIHLHSHYNQEISTNEDHEAMVFLSVIGIMVLFIAWINYINLYTALVSERTKEVGVRKSLGSSKLQLIWQYLTEAGIINMLSVLLALVMVYAVIQQGESWGVVFQLPEFSWYNIVLPIGFFAVSTLISGLYPALLLAKAGHKLTNETVKYRNWLVIGQFTVSAALITGTFLVVSQFYYMQNAPTGINTSSVVVVPLTDFKDDREEHVRSLQRVKGEMASIPGVVSAAYGSDIPGTEVGWRGGSIVIGTGSNEVESHLVYRMTLDENLLDLLKIDVVAGRGFIGPQDSLTVLINERAIAEYGFSSAEEAINQRIRFPGLDTLRVVGVVEDYFQEALSEPIKPTAYFQVPNEIRYLFVKYNASNEAEILTELESLVNTHFPKNNFDPQLLEENMGDRHASTEQFLFLFNAFSGLAILISVLGLIGLANYNARKHQKEMSIRKVLGASTASLNLRYLTAFVRLALIGNLIAIPVIYYVGSDWLAQFANRIGFDWSYPFYTATVCMVITVCSTLYSTHKAANTNPVRILRAE